MLVSIMIASTCSQSTRIPSSSALSSDVFERNAGAINGPHLFDAVYRRRSYTRERACSRISILLAAGPIPALHDALAATSAFSAFEYPRSRRKRARRIFSSSTQYCSGCSPSSESSVSSESLNGVVVADLYPTESVEVGARLYSKWDGVGATLVSAPCVLGDGAWSLGACDESRVTVALSGGKVLLDDDGPGSDDMYEGAGAESDSGAGRVGQ